MKSIIFLACLVLSAHAAPQKTIQQSAVKSEKLQFAPQDAQVAQVYSGSVASRPVTGSAVDQVIAGNVAVPQVVPALDQVIPGYYSGANVVYPGQVVPGAVYGGNVVPYYSAGRSTVTTTTGQSGLPTGTVYEHQGTTHIGHTANAVHIKRPGQYYQPQAVIPGSPYYAAAGGYVAGAQPVPAHHLPAQSWSQTYYHGQTQYINGQPAQYLNGQWYYVNSALPQQQVNPLVNQYSSVYTNLRANVLPLSTAGKALIQPGTQYIQPAVTQYIQPGTQYTQSVVGYRPANDNKWYTKTNTQQVAQPFWHQGQVQQAAASSGTKHFASPAKQEVETDKADW